MHDAVIAEISTDAIQNNIRAIRRRIGPNVPICAAVKADAYGHGIGAVVPILDAVGVERLAVAQLNEALALRALGWSRPILCLGAPLTDSNPKDRRERAQEIVVAGVHCTISTVEEAQILSEAARRLHRPAHVEFKLDSGMGRMGLLPQMAGEVILAAARFPNVVIEGVYTHFATSDEPDPAFAREQLARFATIRDRLRNQDAPVRRFHAANSAAIFRLPESHLDLVRPGLCVYGYWDGPRNERPADLRPAMRVVGRLATVRRLPAGHAIGYGCTFTTQRDTTVGVVPIGYADGYRRKLSNRAVMTLAPVRGQPKRTAAVLGRISMDQTTIDLTDAGDVRPGDPVYIFDDDPTAANSVEAVARQLDTISYEITCLIGNRIRRVRL